MLGGMVGGQVKGRLRGGSFAGRCRAPATATLIQIILQVSVVASLAISDFAARRGRSFSAPVQWRQLVSLPSLLPSSLSRPTSNPPAAVLYWPHPAAPYPPRLCLAGKQLPALQDQKARNSNQQYPLDPTQLGPDLSNRNIELSIGENVSLPAWTPGDRYALSSCRVWFQAELTEC